MSERREGLCMVCEREYVDWHAPSPLWNRVVRHEGADEYPFLCPTCFANLATEKGMGGHFILFIDSPTCEHLAWCDQVDCICGYPTEWP